MALLKCLYPFVFFCCETEHLLTAERMPFTQTGRGAQKLSLSQDFLTFPGLSKPGSTGSHLGRCSELLESWGS